MKVLFVLLSVLAIGAGQQMEVTAYSHPQKIDIRRAIGEMLNQTTDPFLVVEDPKTRDFIQFYNQGGNIFIDFPEVGLTTAEVKAAHVYFSKRRIRLKEIRAKNPETGETFFIKSWSKTYSPEEIDKVLNIALGALCEIHEVSESTPLVLTKGWE